MKAQIQTWEVAQRLVEARLRLSIIASVTGLSSVMLRRLWKEVHGSGPAPGKLPESAASFVKTVNDAARMATFVTMHIGIHGKADCNIEKILATRDNYQKIFGPLDINFAYYVVKDVAQGMLMHAECGCCRAKYLYDYSYGLMNKCPFCATSPTK